MSEPKDKQQRLMGYAVLGVAVIAALAVGVFLLFSGGSDEPSPADPVRALYEAINENDEQAFAAALAPSVRDNEAARQTVPFSASLGAFELGQQQAAVDDLKTKVLSTEDGWALVGVTGKLTFDGQERELSETLYVQQTDAGWLVANEQVFAGAFASPQATSSSTEGLGPLEPNRPEIGEPAPDFALVDARDGSTVRKLSDYRGTPIVVNWYASWCGPCKEEIPEFEAAQQALGDEVVFLGVNYKEDQKAAQKPLADGGATFPAVLDAAGSVATHYRVGPGLPQTFFIDADGILRGVRAGQVHEDILVSNLEKIGLTYTPPADD